MRAESSRDGTRPTFIGLGAQKCASTWIHRLLATHPQVALPAVKEIDFFSHYYGFGYQWYERHFAGCTGVPCTGEVSPSYFHDPVVPERVASYDPDLRLIVTLRDPVERALSNHKHEVRLGHFRGDDLSFEAGLANNPMYVEQGLYGQHLESWLRYFPRDQIFVALMEDIRDRPGEVAREVFRFLGIDETFESEAAGRRFNISFANRSQTLVWLKDQAYQMTRSRGMQWLWKIATNLGMREVYRRFNVVSSEVVIPPVEPETLRALRRRFAPDVHRLESLLGRDLGGWLGAESGEANDAAPVGRAAG